MTPPDVHSVFAKRRQRVTRIRRQVIALAVAAFLALWGVIFVQLVSGHDPALAAKASTPAVVSTTSSTPATITTSSSGSSTTSSGSATSKSGSSTSHSGGSTTSSSSSASTTPVTTSQS